MTKVSNPNLGECANLLFGFKPLWDKTDVLARPFFCPAQSSTVTFDTTVSEETGVWSYPIVSIHDDIESLISKLYDYKVLPSDGQVQKEQETVFSMPSGILTLKDADTAASLKKLGDYLGIDLTKDDSYMLVKMVRNDGRAVHQIVSDFGTQHRDEYLTQSARDAIKAFSDLLPENIDASTLQELSLEQSQTLMKLYYEYGTHFVSAVNVGDVFFQIFAINKDRYKDLKTTFTNESNGADEISDEHSLSYIYFTTPYNDNLGHVYGYVTQYAKILSMGKDSMLDSTLKAGQWMENKYSQKDSIFMAFDKTKNAADFCKQFSTVTSIGFELLPITTFFTDNKLADIWNRLFNGAMLQKYGLDINADFGAESGYDWNEIFQESDDSWLSNIATPNIDIYQEHLDISKVSLINQDSVVNFSSFSQVFEIGNMQKSNLPGKNISIIAYTVDTTGSKEIPILELSKDGLASLTLACCKMFGAAIVASSDNLQYYSLLDGLTYKTGEVDETTGRLMIDIFYDIKTNPNIDVVQGLAQNLNFSLVAAQSQLSSRGTNADKISQFEKGYLDWVSEIIPDTCDNADLLNIKTQAMYLSKISGNLQTEGIVVPYLTYDSYTDYVNSMITVADELSDEMRDYQMKISAQKQAELTVKTAQELNENIKKTGELLTDYFTVISKNQSDMSSYYNMIVQQKQNEFDKTITDVNNLNNLMLEQQNVVDKTVDDFKSAMYAWEAEEVVKFCLTIATDVFKIGVAFAIPSTEIMAVKSLGETAHKIQKVLDVLNSIMKLEQDIEQDVKSLQGISAALSMLNSDLEMPSSREWQEFSINLDASLAGVPNDKSVQCAKANLVAAFKILVLRAQAWIDANSKLSQISTDIYYNQRLQKINQDQANRMADLAKSLHMNDIQDPDVASIDLIGLTGQVQFQMKQIMSMLASTLIIQDAAVQYEYLGEPTAITKFDLLYVKQVMVTQQQNIINALNHMNPTPKPVNEPILYRINKVPIKDLTNGNIYEFIIQPSSTEFLKYSMVRADRVVANIIGIEGSDSGEYLINLTYKGNPFEDRDKNGNLITFNTNERYFGPYDYRISDGKPIFGDNTGTIDDKITKITPFSSWEISLPDTKTNKNLAYSDATVDIVLSFNITALLVDPKCKLMNYGNMKLDGASDQSSATLDNLLDQMYQNNAVLKGWDVVFNLMEEPVNKFIADQFKTKQNGDQMNIDIGFCEVIGNPIPDPEPPETPYIASYTKFNVSLDKPLMQFEINNSDYVTVNQNITSGYIQKGSKYVDENFDPQKDCNIEDPDISWGKQKDIDVGMSPYIQGTVALGKVDGLVNDKNGNKNTKSVILDFTKGSFIAQNLNVSVNNTQLREELTTYFTESDIRYIVNTLDLTDIVTLDAMMPQSFKLNVLYTNSKKNILQMFITTNGTAQSNLTINVNEPIPDSYDCSLMVNTKIMFNDIFVQSFNNGKTNITVKADDPGEDFKPWQAEVATGSVVGNVDFGDDKDQYRMGPSGDSINWDISGMTFSRDKINGIALNYSKLDSIAFQYRYITYTQYSYTPIYSDWEDHSVDVTFSLTGYYPITVSGKGKDQTIQIASTPPSVNVDNSSLKPTGPCECNDDTLQVRVKDEMKKDIPSAIQDQVGEVSFKAISTFALENLLFPAENFIQMDYAYVPCDLVILGHFIEA